MKQISFLLFFFLIFQIHLKSQSPAFRAASYTFDNDSLNGFDENAARASAISQQFIGRELKVRMYQLKRRYINDKYNLWQPVSTAKKASTNTTYAFAACINEDFEASASGTITSNTAITGWVLSGGINDPSIVQNANSCNLLGCCTGPTAQSEILTTPFIDPMIGSQYPVYSVFGTSTINSANAAATNTQLNQPLLGNKVIRINNGIYDYSIEKLTKTFSVTAANSLLQYAFLSVFATSHPCCDAGIMHIRLYNASGGNTLIPCYSYSYSATDQNFNICNYSPYNPEFRLQNSNITYINQGFQTVIYNSWRINSVDLTPYLNQTLTLEVVLTDCSAGAHFGYAYFDAQCTPSQIQNNGIAIPAANNTTVNVTSCSATATLVAPQGFNSYSWTGPAGFTASTSVIQTTMPGSYTLSINQGTFCSSILTQNINLSIPPPLLLNVASSLPVICPGTGQQVIITATGQGVSTYAWNNGSITNSIIVSPIVTTTYVVTGTSTTGCSVTKTFVQPVSVLSPPYITSSQADVCTGQSAILTAIGFTNYIWSNGATTPTISVSPLAPTVYSVSGTNADGCAKTANIGQNYIATSLSVTSSASLICPGESVTLTALTTGFTGYLWNTTLSNTASIVVSPMVTTTYSVQCSNAQGCNGTASITQNVDACVFTGIQALSPAENGISLYPNPNNGEFILNIKKPVKNAELIIEGTLGQLLFTQTVITGENKIRPAGFATGVYYYKVISNKKSIGQGKFKID